MKVRLFTATLAVYLNALPGKGAHVVTVNDYLAKRDAEWMGKVYNFLGMSVGTILLTSRMQKNRPLIKQILLTEPITNMVSIICATTWNMTSTPDAKEVSFFAIVDEVDSILIDEARTPLIISGPAEGKTDVYVQIDKIPGSADSTERRKRRGRLLRMRRLIPFSCLKPVTKKLEAIMSRMGLLPEGQSLYSPSEHHASPLSQCSIESSYNLYQRSALRRSER